MTIFGTPMGATQPKPKQRRPGRGDPSDLGPATDGDVQDPSQDPAAYSPDVPPPPAYQQPAPDSADELRSLRQKLSAISLPKEYDDAAFARAQQADIKREGVNDVGDALYSAVTRSPMRPTPERSSAGDMSARLAFHDKGAAEQKARLAEQRASDENDPNSATSKETQNLVASLHPEMTKDIGPFLSRMSHAKLIQYMPWLKDKTDKLYDLQKEGLINAQKDRASAQKLEEEKKTTNGMVDTIMRSYGQKYRQELTPEVEQALRSGSKDAAEKALANLQSRETAEIGARKAVSGERQATVAEKGLGLNEGSRHVSGFHSTDPAGVLQPGQAADLAEQHAARDSIRQKIAESQDILKKNGGVSINSSGAAMTALNQKFAELMPLLVKSGGFGNLTVGHQHLLEQAMSSPNDWRNFVNSGRLPEILAEINRSADASVAVKAKALGQEEDRHELSVSEERHLPDGRVIQMMSDGSKRLKPNG